MIKIIVGSLFLALGALGVSLSQSTLVSPVTGNGTDDRPANSVELGAVNWMRDYDDAIAKSKQTGKPLFLLFQEVPG